VLGQWTLLVLASADLGQALPAKSPIGGFWWTTIVPAALFTVAALATLLLYRRFSRD